MTCPRCSNELQPQHREGVEIDICPQCGGIWLDRGELSRLTDAEGQYYRRNRRDDDIGGGRGGRRRGFFQNLLDNLGNLGD